MLWNINFKKSIKLSVVTLFIWIYNLFGNRVSSELSIKSFEEKEISDKYLLFSTLSSKLIILLNSSSNVDSWDW